LGTGCKPATIWARLAAEGKAASRRRSALGMIVAAVAIAIECVVVSDGERDFEASVTD
jgi:hypothetical protein